MTELSKEQMRDRIGNLDQIRELLFGQQSREYSERIEAIESDLANFKRQMEDHLTQLHKELSDEIQATRNTSEKQLKYVSANSQENTSHLNRSIEENHNKAIARINSIEQRLNTTSTSLRTELSQTKEELKSDLTQLKQKVDEEIKSHFGELGETKISRDDFAEVLFNMCLKIKGSDFLEKEEEQPSDYLLPESFEPNKD